MVPIQMNQTWETVGISGLGNAYCFMLNNPVDLFELCFFPVFLLERFAFYQTASHKWGSVWERPASIIVALVAGIYKEYYSQIDLDLIDKLKLQNKYQLFF